MIQQDYPNFEHIIYDGGSEDETVAILRKYPHLKWVSEKDSGQSNAVNKGFKKASGEIIAWINSDDYYQAGAFSVVADFFLKNPDKSIVMGDCNLVDEDGRIIDRVLNYERGFEELRKYRIGRSVPTQPAIFFRRRLLQECGLLDEMLHYGMDYDLWMRFAQRHRFYHIGITFANYRFHSKSKNRFQGWSNCLPEWEAVAKKYNMAKAV